MEKFYSHSYKDTIALGERVGRIVTGPKVIAFYGGLGVGKTAFVSGIAKGMGLTVAVSSPTFSIVHVYGNKDELCHFDMYRVNSWEGLDSTGYFEYLEQGSVLCVEWSENIENALPQDTIRITIEKGNSDEDRIIKIEGMEGLLK